MSNEMCPICGEGHLTEQVELEATEYKGEHGSTALHYLLCDVCGSEQAGAKEVRKNKRAVIAFKKKVDGLLSSSEIRELRKNFNISQSDAAKIFGGGPVAFSKYESDDVMQSESMDKLLRLALSVPGVFEALRDQGQESLSSVKRNNEAFTRVMEKHHKRHSVSMRVVNFNDVRKGPADYSGSNVFAANDSELSQGIGG
ncbi:type II toxin-antitoxin system MqsA family antitoxin [Microbulbifer pacificus]|uniref:Type II toxin-antitoxin system MqsA family antitoxin n=1 Tax=Microbulbifer pacificus TaxID=407164 RepID=A0AAU0MVM6_9GAMM|nr:type II toxin-antitoxin system MqsA family antitoxin [Microbulbifer pacificus]WOX04717.1 type II toxin-antitoxin system MqsA family antitoxin [Microbulbifer pacificus]